MKKFASALLLSAAISAPAFAANAGTGYVAVDYGTWTMTNAGLQPNPGVLTFSGGYHFTPNLGAEAGFALVGDSTVNYFGGSATYSQSALKFAAVGTLPLAPEFDVFGKLGMNIISAQYAQTGFVTTNASTTNVMFGFGGQFNVSKQLGVRIQYENLGKTKGDPAAIGADVSSMSIGVVFNL